jgi:DNA-binding transcriptional MerR regulator
MFLTFYLLHPVVPNQTSPGAARRYSDKHLSVKELIKLIKP